MDNGEVVYAEIEGRLIFTDDGWCEVKFGIVFRSQDLTDGHGQLKEQAISQSVYTAHLGGHEPFCDRLCLITDTYAALGERLVLLSDGAHWIGHFIAKRYPRATHILDFYHAASCLAAFLMHSLPTQKTDEPGSTCKRPSCSKANSKCSSPLSASQPKPWQGHQRAGHSGHELILC